MMLAGAAYKQTATYWGAPAVNGFGVHTFASPRQIKCYWVDRDEMVINLAGEEVRSKAHVFVQESLDIGGYLMLGTSAVADPTEVPGTAIIIDFKSVPSITRSEITRKAYL